VLPPGRRLAPGYAGPPQAARRPDATPTSSGPGAGAVAPRRACRPSVLERATARPSGRGLRFTLPRGAGRVTVTVRRGDRVVARFTRSRSFTWSGRGRGRAVRDGVHTVRFAAGRRGSDVAVARRGGRFRARPDFALAPLCGTVALLRVDPVVGRTARVTFRLGRRGDAVVSAGDGRRVLRGVAAGRTVRIRVAVRRGARGGSVPVTLRVTAGGRTVTRRVVALRR
jgi:hypothetical protein